MACVEIYLFIAQARHLVHKFFLNHEGGQIGSVTGQEDDSEESPHRHYEFTGGAFGVLHRYRVVKHQAPQQPHRFPHSKGRSVGIYRRQDSALTSRSYVQAFLPRFHLTNNKVLLLHAY